MTSLPLQKSPAVRGTLVLLFLTLAACGRGSNARAVPPSTDVGHSKSALFVNGGFEGDDAGAPPSAWVVERSLNNLPSTFGGGGTNGLLAVPPQSEADLNLSPDAGVYTTIVVAGSAPESMPDPDLGPGEPFRYPKYGTRSVVVNTGATNGKNYNVNAIRQQMTVSATDVDPVDNQVHIRFVAAPVLEVGSGHSPQEQPYFFLQLKDVQTGKVLYSDFSYASQAGVPWQTLNSDPSGNKAQFTDWQVVDVAPGASVIGHTVELVIYAAGCSRSGHWGRVYVDSFGLSLPGLYVTGTAPKFSTPDTDLTYQIRYTNGGIVDAPSSVVTFNTPPNTTFQSVGLAGCTAPAPGTANATITCPVGTVAAGGGGTFPLTVHTVPNVTGLVTAGNYSIFASNSSNILGAKLNTQVIAPANAVASGGNNQSTPVTQDFAQKLSVTVTDASNNPVPGATVTFTAPSLGASATFGGASSAVVTTDVSGVATVTATANTIAGGPYTVNASVSGFNVPFTLTNVPGAPASITVVSGDNQSTRVSTDFATHLALTVLDAQGNPIPSYAVTFTVPSSGATASLTGITTTDASGSVNLVAHANSVPGGPYPVTATAGSVSATFHLTNLAGPPATLTLSGPDPQSTQVNTRFPSNLQAVVKDAAGNPLQGIAVTFTTPGSGASAFISGNTTTDVNGQVSVVATANSVASSGFYPVQASVSGGTNPSLTFNLQNLPGPAALIQPVSGNNQSTQVTTNFATPLSVRVTDANGNPLQGVVVSLAAPTTGATAIFTGSTTTAADGTISVTATAGTQAGGPYSVMASFAQPGPVVVFSLTNTPGPASSITVLGGDGQRTQVSTTFPSQLQAVVKDANGNVLPGQTVTFTAPSSGASASLSGTFVTGANGQVSVTATANSVIGGPYSVQATVGALTPATFALTNTPGTPTSLRLTQGDSQSTPVTQKFPTTLIATVVDSYGNVVPNVPVRFSVPVSGASATLSATSPSTDASGRVVVQATANTVAGSYSVTADIGGAVPPVLFTLTNTPGAATSLKLIAGGRQSTQVESAFPSALVVEADDAFGNAVPSVHVLWSAPGSAVPGATFSQSDILTDAAGRASVIATADSLEGTYPASATLSTGQSAPFVLTNTKTVPVLITVESGTPQQAAVGSPYTSPLVVRVTSGGHPVPGAVVTFLPPLSGPSVTLSSFTSTTDATGHAQVTATANTKAGAVTVSASVNGGSQPAVFALTNLAGAPATIVADPSSTPQTTQSGLPFVAPLIAVVQDSAGNPVPGVQVTFTAPGASPTATLNVSAAVTTDARGRASALATADSGTGSYVVNATAPGVTGSAAFQLTNGATRGETLAIVSGSPQSTMVATAFQPLVVVVTDASGAPVPGRVLTFTAPAAGASCTLPATVPPTDGSGQVSLGATAGNVAGTYEVLVTSAQASAPLRFVLTNLPGAPATLSALSLSTPQSTQVTTAFALPLVVSVQDGFGNPVPGVAATFTAPGTPATATLTLAPPATDAAGLASVVAIASPTAGSYEVPATVAGVMAPARFALTNLAGSSGALTAKGGLSQSTLATTPFPAPLVVQVTDGSGNPVVGAPVTLALPSSGPSGTAPSSVYSTDASGQVSIPVTANATPGVFTASLSVPGAPAPVLATLTILPIPTRLDLVLDNPTPSKDATEKLTATVASDHGTPTGTVRFVVDGVQVGTAPLVNGVATFTAPAAGLGTHKVQAFYDAQGSYDASTSASQTVTVTKDAGSLNGGGCGAAPGSASPGGTALFAGLLFVMALALRSRRRAPVAAKLALAAVLVGGPLARAQSGGADVALFHAAPAGSDWFALDSLDFRGDFKPAGRLILDYAHDPLIVYNADGTRRFVAIRHDLGMDVGASLAAFDRVRLSFNLPVTLHQVGQPSVFNGERVDPAASSGVGDLVLGGDLRLFGQYRDVLSAAVGVNVALPTGSRPNDLGNGRFTVEPHLKLAGGVGILAYAVQAGFALRQGQIADIRFNNELRFGGSLGVRLFDERLLIGPEVYGTVDVGPSAGEKRPTALEGDLGAHLSLGQGWQVSVGVGRGVAKSPGAPDGRVLGALAWAFDAPNPAPVCPAPPVVVAPAPAPAPAVLPPPRVEPPPPARVEPPAPAPAPAPVAAPKPVPPPASSVVQLDSDRISLFKPVVFDTARARLRPESYPVLDGVVKVMLDNPQLTLVRVEGHTDTAGKAQDNLLLSKRRAKRVKAYLVSKGVAAKRLVTAGYGGTRPVESNSTAEGRFHNRRVDFIILEDSSKPRSAH